jgi:hypothetical protein
MPFWGDICRCWENNSSPNYIILSPKLQSVLGLIYGFIISLLCFLTSSDIFHVAGNKVYARVPDQLPESIFLYILKYKLKETHLQGDESYFTIF